MKQRNDSLDAIKGIAIISVALYHFGGGILPYGYLGVDIFFVISGFLLIRQLYNQFVRREFHYWSFIIKKIIRLWPIIIIAIIVSMVAGYFLMLPNDYENLSESAVASALFANNILQCITTKNYWDIVNMYKPLMHLWYVGLLMQAYIILPILYLLIAKLYRNIRKTFIVTTTVITIISLILFIMPSFSSAWKFYYLPFRLFELTAGGLIVFFAPKCDQSIKKTGVAISLIFLLIMLCSRWEIGSSSIMLLVTVIATIIFIICTQSLQIEIGVITKICKAFSEIGKRSYSIYIWHQVIIAFIFYSVFPSQNILSFIVCLIGTTILSIVSYQFLEKPFGIIANNKKKGIVVLICSCIVAIGVSAGSFKIYLNAGVVRNVPELDITANNVHRGMHSEYCDRVYSWNKPFSNDSKKKILVVGNSFGRDWANILYELIQSL